MKIFLIACVLLSAATEDGDTTSTTTEQHSDHNTTRFLKTTRDVIITPAVAFFGKSWPGYLVRCLQENPTQCENYYVNGGDIQALVISGNYIYAGTQCDTILRCHLYTKESCKSFYRGSDTVYSLAVGRGWLFAGLKDGNIVRCELHQLSCQVLHNMNLEVNSLLLVDKTLYVGTGEGEMTRCSLTVTNCTLLYNMTSGIAGLAKLRNNIYAVTYRGQLWNCSTNPTTCTSVDLNYDIPFDSQAFNDSLFVCNYDSGIGKWVNDSCVSYVRQVKAWSMAMAYSTYHMQSRFSNEEVTCSWQSDSKCPRVVYYNELERAMLEVYVKDGRLYNFRDALVDTSEADQGHAGPAAIFIMGPDGTIFLSNLHKKGFIHTSSLAAGSPVSGAGEIIVKNGVIVKIMACSEHYKADVDLNKQVIQSLITQGYTDRIESVEC